ncbi:hypothetical protein [Nonomuraea dietziae]|uniref:hypothetical protein n=1 Tax=Nonomuraea dietziae TaxID=65515 RepID=UPI00342A7AF1
MTVLPGLITLVLFGDLGQGRAYNDAIPLLMGDLRQPLDGHLHGGRGRRLPRLVTHPAI